MAQHYTDPTRADDPYALPDCETFYRTEAENRADGWYDDDGDDPTSCLTDEDRSVMPAGWYVWSCQPGCMPDSDPLGPYSTEQEALDDWREQAGILDDE